jgi:hypothetical protein
VWYPYERSRIPRQPQAMLDFSGFVFVQGHMDILLVRRILLNVIIMILRYGLEHFTDVSQRCLPKILSDHFPLMLD